MTTAKEQNEIDLRDLWKVFKKCWLLVLAAVFFLTGAAFLVGDMTFRPLYSSTATLYILNRSGEEEGASASSDFSLALQVVNDCSYLLRSRSVLEQVCGELSIGFSEEVYEELAKAISTSNPSGTRILEVTVQASSPGLAKALTDRICDVGAERIEEAMGFRQVNLYEYGTKDPEPCNRRSKKIYLAVGVAGGLLVYGCFLLAFFMNDRFTSGEDVERLLGISLLGEIPDERERKKGKGYKRYYKGYGRK